MIYTSCVGKIRADKNVTSKKDVALMITLQWNEIFMESLHEDLPGSEHLIPVFSIHNQEYQWKQMFALFSPAENTFYWTTGGGCACCSTLFAHIAHADEMTKGSAADVKRAVRDFMQATPGIITEEERTRIFSKVKMFAGMKLGVNKRK